MNRIEGDIYFNGNVSMKSLSAPAGSITDAMVAGAAGIQATKLIHQNRTSFAQPNTTATTETKGAYVVYGATGTIIDFRAGSIVACIGAATITIDLKKNGTSVLSAPITLNSSSVARVAQAGTVTVAGLVAGDWLEISAVATAGGGTIGTGLFATTTIQEAAQ